MIAILAYAVASFTGKYNDTGGGKHRPENIGRDNFRPKRKTTNRRRPRKTAR